jgi:hypothetical protein
MELIEALQSEDPTAARRCLVMTGGMAEALPDGVAFLAKPFQLGELIEAVRALHQGAATPAPDHDASVTADSAMRPPGAAAGQDRLAAAQHQEWKLLAITRGLRARERYELIDFLHDGPIQELTAATLELQMMSRSGAPGQAAPADEVSQRLAAAAGSLRWLVDGSWPFMAPETRLAAALQQRTAWLLGAPMTVEAGENQAGPDTLEIPVIVDVVELMLHGMAPAAPPVRAHVAVRTGEDLIQIELTLTTAGDDQAIGDPAAARAALDELACALGASADAQLHERPWRARIDLPRRQPAVGPK